MPSQRSFGRVLSAAGCLLLLTAGAAACEPEARYNDGLCSIGTEVLNTPLDHWIRAYQADQGLRDSAAEAGPLPLTQDPEAPDAARMLHEGRGGAFAPSALLRELCDLAPMERPMQSAELHRFAERYAALPLAVPVAVDALAITVPDHSPLNRIRLSQVRAVFTEGPHSLYDHFPELREDPEWGTRDLTIHGVNSASDRYRWFKEQVLKSAELSDRVIEESGPLALVDAIGRSRHGFGYARPAELNSETKALPLAEDGAAAPDDASAAERADFIAPDADAIRSGRYPLTRYLYVYLPPKSADRPLNPEAIEFLRFVLTPAEQDKLRPQGLYPLSEADRRAALASLDAYAAAAPPYRPVSQD